MPRKISTLLEVTSKELYKKGAFDSFIDVDSRLHVDPSLLEVCKIPEFKNTHEDFENYFNQVLALVINSKTKEDKLLQEAPHSGAYMQPKYRVVGISLTSRQITRD